MKPGVSCQSLDQVNTLVDQGKLAQAKPAPSTETTLTVDIRYLADAEDSTDSIKRNPETVMRLWIAPYQDKPGQLFFGQYRLSRDSTGALVTGDFNHLNGRCSCLISKSVFDFSALFARVQAG